MICADAQMHGTVVSCTRGLARAGALTELGEGPGTGCQELASIKAGAVGRICLESLPPRAVQCVAGLRCVRVVRHCDVSGGICRKQAAMEMESGHP